MIKNQYWIVKQGFKYYVVGPVDRIEDLPRPLPYPDNFLSSFTNNAARKIQRELNKAYVFGVYDRAMKEYFKKE